MIPAIRSRLTYSNVIATLALFAALGGVAVAAGLPRNSVGTKQLKRRAVTAAKLAPKSVINGKLGPNSVGPGNIGNGAVTTAKLAANSVIASTIKNGVVTTNKLNNEAVTTPKLANEGVTSAKLGKGSVTAAKLNDEIGPLLGTLKSGQTLRGMFNLGGGAEDQAESGQTFQFPLLNAPAANIVDPPTATTAACPGLTGGSGQTPQAAPGQLCVYLTSESELAEISIPAIALTRLGFGIEALGETGKKFRASGQWAVTAP
jgi:hypothetical protein